MESVKPSVLIVAQWYEPAYKAGGPIRSVVNLVEQLKDHLDVWVLTGSKDLGESEDLDVETNNWIEKGGARLFYASSDSVARAEFERVVKGSHFSSVYLNSLFSPTYTLYPLRALKRIQPKPTVVLAPRGMLSEAALKIKRLKKRLFFSYAKFSNLFQGVVWHATDEKERNEIIKGINPSTPIVVAPNLMKPFVREPLHRMGLAPVQFCFVGRIAPIKNLDFLIRQFEGLDPGKYVFQLFGPIEDEVYFNTCKKTAVELNVSMKYLGEGPPQKVSELIKQSHFLVLPSKSENFGHVVVEAWSYGVPVIISDKTPWRGLAAKQIGWDLALEEESWRTVLGHCLEMPDREYEDCVENCFSFAQELSTDPKSVEAYIQMFTDHG